MGSGLPCLFKLFGGHLRRTGAGRWPGGDPTCDHAVGRGLGHAEAFRKRELLTSCLGWLSNCQSRRDDGSGGYDLFCLELTLQQFTAED